jgi:hypothetical protein
MKRNQVFPLLVLGGALAAQAPLGAAEYHFFTVLVYEMQKP